MSPTCSELIQVGNLGPARAASGSPDPVTQPLGSLASCPAPSSCLQALPGSREGVKCFWRPGALPAAVPPAGAAARGWPGMFAMQSWREGEGGRAGGSRPVEAGRPARRLSNRPGPAGSCNSCPSCLFPPCLLPPPSPARQWGAACRGRRGTEARREWRLGVACRGFQGETEKECSLLLSHLHPEKAGPLPKVTQQGTTELDHTLDSTFFPLGTRLQVNTAGGHVATQVGSSESQGPSPNRRQTPPALACLFTQALGSQRE